MFSTLSLYSVWILFAFRLFAHMVQEIGLKVYIPQRAVFGSGFSFTFLQMMKVDDFFL
jgi:hypothetical protein